MCKPKEPKSPTALFQSIQDWWTLYIARVLLMSLSVSCQLIEAFLSRQNFYTDSILCEQLCTLLEYIDAVQSRLEKYHS